MKSMNYYIYNTDARALAGPPWPRFRILIDQHFAAAGGDRQRFGEQFRQLDKGDILLMYENGAGVVAVGRVTERWDGVQHKERPQYYTVEEMATLTGGPYEYRIPVGWSDQSGNPITLADLRKHLHSAAFRPRGTVRRIVKHRVEIERIAEKRLATPEPTRLAADLEAPPPRIETTTYRVLRDTEVALRVKKLHDYECQVCGHVIALSNGRRYAEAHHIRPLGRQHHGPDVAGNILCVCPNHHAELDLGVSAIVLSSLRSTRGHVLDPQYIDYHNRVICSKCLPEGAQR
jgi:hypothetical protein